MAACMAAPWPSQQRRSTSERHSALARMRERHARADHRMPDPEPVSRHPQQPRPPAQPRGCESRPGQRSGGLNGSGSMDMKGSHSEPWAAAWSPNTCPFDDESPPPKPQRPVPPEEASLKGRPSCPDRCLDDGASKSNRVRGPAEVRSARGEPEVQDQDDCLPSGAKGADFKTLQAMIARGIQEAETGAVKLESDMPVLIEDEEERRFRERQRQRRQQEASQREKEREQARQKRRREQEERERRQAEELEREEREELSLRAAREQAEAQCRKELAAAMRIQAHVRGRRARAGKPCSSFHNLKAVLHWEPHMKQQ